MSPEPASSQVSPSFVPESKPLLLSGLQPFTQQHCTRCVRQCTRLSVPGYRRRIRPSMRPCVRPTRCPSRRLTPSKQAHARRTPIEWRPEDIPAPSFTDVRVLRDFPLATLCEYIDWSPLFYTWGLTGVLAAFKIRAEFAALGAHPKTVISTGGRRPEWRDPCI